MEVMTRSEYEKVDEEELDREEPFTVPDQVEDEEDDVFAEDEGEDGVKEKGYFELTNPIIIDEQKVKRLHYDFTTIRPVQYINIVKKVQKKESAQVPELNMSVQFNVFCRAAGIPVAILKNEITRVDEFTAVCQLARDFLLSKQGASDEVL